MKPHQYTNAEGNVLILKRISKNRTGYNDFKYPEGIGTKITCPDWSPEAKCGGGIHGWPWGFGLGEGMDFDINDDIWIVLSDKPENVVGDLEKGWKCKAKDPAIIFEGSFKDAFGMVTKEWPNIISKMTQSSEVNADDCNLAASGDNCKLAASGNWSNLAASGNESNLAASGIDSVCMIANINGKAKVGKNGMFVLTYIDKNNRYRSVIGYEGENGIKADTWYMLDGNGIIIKHI